MRDILDSLLREYQRPVVKDEAVILHLVGVAISLTRSSGEPHWTLANGLFMTILEHLRLMGTMQESFSNTYVQLLDLVIEQEHIEVFKSCLVFYRHLHDQIKLGAIDKKYKLPKLKTLLSSSHFMQSCLATNNGALLSVFGKSFGSSNQPRQLTVSIEEGVGGLKPEKKRKRMKKIKKLKKQKRPSSEPGSEKECLDSHYRSFKKAKTRNAILTLVSSSGSGDSLDEISDAASSGNESHSLAPGVHPPVP